MFDSVRVRLSLWHVGVVAFLLIAFSGAVYVLLSNILYSRSDAVLESVVDGTVSMLAKESSEIEFAAQAPRHALRALSYPDTSLAIFGEDGKLIAEKTDGGQRVSPPVGMTGFPLRELHQYTTRVEPDARGVYRAAALRATFRPVNKTYIVVASQTLEPVMRQLETLRRIFYIALPAVLLLAGIGGWFLARKSLAPVVAMSEQACRISVENLDERLTIASPRDELGRLACAFNELLGRLDNAFSTQRQFVADASHELRTPVSVIRTATEVALDSTHRDENEYRNVLAMIDGQVRRLSRIVENLFRLARADAGRYSLQPHGFYLDELLTETVRAATVLAASKRISVEIPKLSELPYYGDEDLLRQMLLNLLDNSVKYTMEGGTIRLGIEVRDQQYAITISDSGVGIPLEDQPHIFERFFRADRSRSRTENDGIGGAGLGLSISRWIAEAHEGRLELLHSDEKGSTFLALLPVSKDWWHACDTHAVGEL
jgi:two-component system OmpR family sensor kinase